MKNTVKIIQGTSHFPSFAHALLYFLPYGFDRKDVNGKIDAGEIHICEPPLKAGQELRIIDNRYHIAE